MEESEGEAQTVEEGDRGVVENGGGLLEVLRGEKVGDRLQVGLGEVGFRAHGAQEGERVLDDVVAETLVA